MILSVAGRGEGHFTRVVYGTAGSLSIPGDRTGQPLKLTLRRNGEDRIIPTMNCLGLVPDFRLDDDHRRALRRRAHHVVRAPLGEIPMPTCWQSSSTTSPKQF